MTPRLAVEVSPALVTFGELLMLPFGAMQAAIDDELTSNPALERLDQGECPVCRGSWHGRCPVCTPLTRRHGSGPVRDRTDVAAAVESDVDRLRREVRLETDRADAEIVDHVVDSLDHHGWLDRSCAQLAAELGVAERRVAQVLDVVRMVGPPGVGASGATESLLMQVDACGLSEERAQLIRAVVRDHLTALAKGHFASIAEALGVTRDEIRQALELIRSRLRPYPAFDGRETTVAYVVPDVVVRQLAGEVSVELVEPALARLAIREPGGDPDASRSSLLRAGSFLAQLRDRWSTVWRVADHAVRRQPDFLAHGAAGLLPLTRAEVAAELGLHESTVSRAVADKYVLLPDRTTVALATFFGGGGAVDDQLRRLLESATKPMSDQHLADLLRGSGYPVARRTVAKHRARLGFHAAPLR